MNARHRITLSAVMVAAIGLSLAACGSGSSGGSAKSRSDMSPTDALNAAIADLGKTSYAVELDSPGDDAHEVATVDPRARVGTVNATAVTNGVDTRMDAILVSPDMWIKLNLGPANTRFGISRRSWMKLDATKIADSKALPIDVANWADALDITKLLSGVMAERTDANTFTGTIDLTQATGVSAPDPAAVAKAGANAKSVAFQATVDDQGRLTGIKIDGSSVSPDLAVSISFSDYGTPARITRPNDNEIVPTPETVYQLLAG